MPVFFRTAEVDASPVSIADTAELQLLVSGDPYLSYSEYRDLFPAGSTNSATDLENGFAEITERARIMQTHYPFTFDGQGISIDKSGAWQAYAFLLLLSLEHTPLREDKDWKRSDPLFDAIVMESLSSRYRGVLGFGWPPRERPTTFPEAIDWAAEKMGLKTAEKLPDHRQDGGVDVIAWNAYSDGGTGFPVLLVQNTIQRRYSGKPADIDPALWRDWIKFGNTPAVGFAIPFILTPDDPWRPEVVSRVHDFMDRQRLMEGLASTDPTHSSLWHDLTTFVEKEIREIRLEAMTGAPKIKPTGPRKGSLRAPRRVGRP